MVVQITLPRLAGTRDAAQRLVTTALRDAGAETEALVSARLLSTATGSFADELVKLLQASGIATARIEGAPSSFANLVRASAARRKYAGVRIMKESDLLTA